MLWRQVEGQSGAEDDVFQAHALQVLSEALALQLGGELGVFARVIGEPVADDLDDLRDAATGEIADGGDALVREAEDFGHAEDFEVAAARDTRGTLDGFALRC